MALDDLFQRYGRPSEDAEIRLTAYLARPDTLTADRIAYHDRSAAEMIARCNALVSALTEYRQALAERYASLAVMPYRTRLELERVPLVSGKIRYDVRIVRTYEDGTTIKELSETYPGAERAKAFSRFSALKKERPGIETIEDTARRPWER